jgi:hypothetical protein
VSAPRSAGGRAGPGWRQVRVVTPSHSASTKLKKLFLETMTDILQPDEIDRLKASDSFQATDAD